MEVFKLSNEQNGKHQENTVSSLKVCSSGSSKKQQDSSKGMQRATLLVLLVFIVVVVLQIPTILYYTKLPSIEFSILDSVNLETCSIDNYNKFQVSLNNERYTCNDSEIIPQQIYLLKLVDGLCSITGNSQCSDAILSFLCAAVTSYDDGIAVPNLTTDCTTARDSVCATEWRMVESFLNISLIDCRSFNDSGNITFSQAPILQCPEGFGVFCGSICQPLCSEVSLFNDAATTANKILSIIFHSLSVISGIITLVVCFIHREKMFHFPLIYVVYNTITFEVVSLFLLLPYIIGANILFCSRPSLIVTNSKPTVFCKLQGLVTHTGTLVIFGFLVCHLSHLLHSLIQPHKAQVLMNSAKFKRSAHIIEVTVVLTCGLTPGIVLVSTSGYSYSGFLPVCNILNPTVLFYTLILPISFESTAILCMLLISLWILHQHQNILGPRIANGRLSIKDIIKYSTPEAKLIVIFSYYSITAILLLIHLVISLHIINTTVKNVTMFFLCSAGGYRAECEKYITELHQKIILSIVFDLISTMFAAMLNIINLLYVLQYRDIKNMKKSFRARHKINTAMK